MIIYSILITLVALILAAKFYIIPRLIKRNSIRKYLHEYEGVESKLEAIYKDEQGNTWYQFKNTSDTPYKRGISIELAAGMAELNMIPKMFDDYVVAMRKAINSKDLTKAGYLLERMNERRLLAAEEETLKELANCYFLIEGENPASTSPYWFEKKKEIWNKSDKDYAFFLHSALKRTRNISELSETEILNSLRTQAALKLLHQL